MPLIHQLKKQTNKLWNKLEFWKLLACTLQGNAQAWSLNVLLWALGLGGIPLLFFLHLYWYTCALSKLFMYWSGQNIWKNRRTRTWSNLTNKIFPFKANLEKFYVFYKDSSKQYFGVHFLSRERHKYFVVVVVCSTLFLLSFLVTSSSSPFSKWRKQLLPWWRSELGCFKKLPPPIPAWSLSLSNLIPVP